MRIKRLFPGQPAEENGTIAAGDIILAVNGRPTEGLVFQEVLHLLRGASQEVMLLLCRPSPGALPEIDQGWQVNNSCVQAPGSNQTFCLTLGAQSSVPAEAFYPSHLGMGTTCLHPGRLQQSLEKMREMTIIRKT